MEEGDYCSPTTFFDSIISVTSHSNRLEPRVACAIDKEHHTTVIQNKRGRGKGKKLANTAIYR